MPVNKRKLGPKPKQESVEAKERELDTIREINKVLDHQQVPSASGWQPQTRQQLATDL